MKLGSQGRSGMERVSSNVSPHPKIKGLTFDLERKNFCESSIIAVYGNMSDSLKFCRRRKAVTNQALAWNLAVETATGSNSKIGG